MANNKGTTYRGYGQAYSDEENEWLRCNIDLYTYPELTRRFNEQFDRNLKSVSDHCIKSLGLHKTTNVGNIGKGRKDYVRRCPIGHERRTMRGDVYVKISDDYIEGKTPSLAMNPNYKLKKDIVWEAVHGKRPKDCLIVHLDMNPGNLEIDNLYCVPRNIALMLSKNKWWSNNRDVTLAAIKWCELYYAMREID